MTNKQQEQALSEVFAVNPEIQPTDIELMEMFEHFINRQEEQSKEVTQNVLWILGNESDDVSLPHGFGQ